MNETPELKPASAAWERITFGLALFTGFFAVLAGICAAGFFVLIAGFSLFLGGTITNQALLEAFGLLCVGGGILFGLMVWAKRARSEGYFPNPRETFITLGAVSAAVVSVVGVVFLHMPGKGMKPATAQGPMVPIDSVSCRSEGDQSTVDVAFGSGGKGPYQLRIDLFSSSPAAWIDRKEKIVSLGERATERVSYRETELESLCVEKLGVGTEAARGRELNVYVTLHRFNPGDHAGPTGETSTGRGLLMVGGLYAGAQSAERR